MNFGQGQRAVLLLAGLVVVVAGLKFGQPLLVPLMLAAVLTAVSTPIIHWLEKKRTPRALAIALTMLINLAVLAGLGTVVGSSLGGFYDALPRYQKGLSELMRTYMDWFAARGIHISSKDALGISSDFGGLVDLLGGLLKSVASAVSTLLFSLLLTAFMLAESGSWGPKIALALGQRREIATATRELQKYLAVKTAANTVTGILCGTWLAVMNVDFPVLWGLITMLLNYIPTVGSIIASIPPVLLAWLAFGPGPALITAVGLVVINTVLGSVVEPRIMGRALGLSPLVVLGSMVFWWWVWGPVGALLSAPLTMMVKILLSAFEDLRWVSIMLGSPRWVRTAQDQWNEAKIANNKAEAVCCCADAPRSQKSGVRTIDPPSAVATATPIVPISDPLEPLIVTDPRVDKVTSDKTQDGCSTDEAAAMTLRISARPSTFEDDEDVGSSKGNGGDVSDINDGDSSGADRRRWVRTLVSEPQQTDSKK